jgi:alpha-tubulin suppressor-like RCC1 family protein
MSSADPAPARDLVILRIAEGGMGFIDLIARQQGRFLRLFARKRLHPSLRADPGFRAMFLDEARLAGLIRDPHVAAALEVGEDGEGPFLLMDYVDGPSLAEVLERVEPRDRLLPVAFCVAVAAQGARGLHAAHALLGSDGTPLGVVHRDISPQNLLIGYDGLVRVADFGIAKAKDNLEQTRVGVLKGNVGYMAPEHLRFQDLDGRSDLFALGVVLYETLTRERLYSGDETAAVARRIVDEPPPDIFEQRDVPPELAALLFELMAKDRALRPPSALVVAMRLDEIAAGLVASDGPFDISAFLQAELGALREQRRAVVDAALARGVADQATASPASATPTATSLPAGALEAAGSFVGTPSRTTAAGPRALARRGRSLLLAALAVAGAIAVGVPLNRMRQRAAVSFSVGAAGLWSGGWHSCARRGAGLACWGSNIRGQLGDGTRDNRGTLVATAVALGEVRDLALGEYHTCAVAADGHVLCWGRNVRGELGRADPTLSIAPLEVPGVVGARAVVAGRQHTCALLAGGAVSCWGSNETGQLGRPPAWETTFPPAPIAGLPPIERLFAGGGNTCATVQGGGGRLLCWGANENGQLGDGTQIARATAAPVPGIEGVVSLDIGNAARAGSKNPDLSKRAGFICGARSDGRVLCWGDGGTGQLGDGARDDRATPGLVRGISDAIQVAVGDMHACALRRSGRVVCWGRNEFGAVGDNTMGPSTVRVTPVELDGVEDVVGIALGGAHSCARRRDGAVFCWGVNNFGQLGDGSTTLRPAPHRVIGLP